MAISGEGLYSYIKHFKNIFVRNHRTNFNITWQKFPLVTLFQDLVQVVMMH